jgi:formate hydrogenlyase subunit 3/multisubunit Na+/H+ antiporter MnhD subunit
MERIISLIVLPLLVGLLLFAVPDKFRTFKGIIALLTSIITAYLTVLIYTSGNQMLQMANPALVPGLTVLNGDIFRGTMKYITFCSDNLSKLIILFVSLFTFLILLYSIIYISRLVASRTIILIFSLPLAVAMELYLPITSCFSLHAGECLE